MKNFDLKDAINFTSEDLRACWDGWRYGQKFQVLPRPYMQSQITKAYKLQLKTIYFDVLVWKDAGISRLKMAFLIRVWRIKNVVFKRWQQFNDLVNEDEMVVAFSDEAVVANNMKVLV